MNQLLYDVFLLIYVIQLAESLDGIMEVSCDVSTNMCLYEHENNINWDTAYDKCLEENANLLTIPSSSVQRQVGEFLKTLELDTTADIWIAGKQSDNSTPIDLTGKPYLSDNYNEDPHDDCVFGRTTGQLTWDNCDEINGDHKVICQGTCSGSDISFGGNCYKLFADASHINEYSWFTARSICRERPGSDVIYTGLDNSTFLQNLNDYLDGDPTFWTGIYRRPWQWIEGSPEEAHTAHYFNFMSGEGDDAGQHCLQIRKLGGSSSWVWSTAPCTKSRTRYFICQNETEVATTEAMPVTSDMTTLVSSDGMTDEEKDTSFNALYLISVIVAVVAGIVVAVVMVLRNKRKQQSSVPVYENDESGRTQGDPTSPSYQDIGEYLTTEQTARVLNHTPRQSTRFLYQNVGNTVAEDSSNEVSTNSHLDTDPAGGDYENIREDIISNPYNELDPSSLSTDHGPYTSLSPQVRD